VLYFRFECMKCVFGQIWTACGWLFSWRHLATIVRTLPVRCTSQKPRPYCLSTSYILLISTPSFSLWLLRSFRPTQWPVFLFVCTRKKIVLTGVITLFWMYEAVFLARYGQLAGGCSRGGIWLLLWELYLYAARRKSLVPIAFPRHTSC